MFCLLCELSYWTVAILLLLQILLAKVTIKLGLSTFSSSFLSEEASLLKPCVILCSNSVLKIVKCFATAVVLKWTKLKRFRNKYGCKVWNYNCEAKNYNCKTLPVKSIRLGPVWSTLRCPFGLNFGELFWSLIASTTMGLGLDLKGLGLKVRLTLLKSTKWACYLIIQSSLLPYFIG